MKHRTLLHIVVSLLLVLVTPAAARDSKKDEIRATPAAAASPEKKSFLERLFSRTPKLPAVSPTREVAAAKPKPKPRPATQTGVRRGQGQRPDPKNGGATTARSVASAAKKPAPAKLPEPAAASVLEKAPAAEPIDTSEKRDAYSPKTPLGCAMRRLWGELSAEAAEPTEVEKIVVSRVRVTAYDKGDPNSAAKKSSTGVSLRPATKTQIGVAAGPAEWLGAYAIVEKDGARRVYLIADVGGAVESQKASGGTAPVLDLYEPKEPGESLAEWQDWDSYQSVELVQVRGAAHLLLQLPSRRDDFLDPQIYAKVVALAGQS
jgi:hypothetical protein